MERERNRQLQTEQEQRSREIREAEFVAERHTRTESQAKIHEHPLARIGTHTWVPTKHWRCDGCGSSSVTTEMIRYRCTRGCNIDLCDQCYGPEAQALAEAQAEVCEASEESLVQRGGQSPLQELSAAQQRARARLRAKQEGRLLESEDGVAEAFAGHVSLGGPHTAVPAAHASPTGLACFQPASNLQPTTVNPKTPPLPGRHDAATASLGRDPPRALHGGRGAAHRNTRLAQRAPSGAVPRPQEIKPKAPGPNKELREHALEHGERVWRVVHGPHVTVRAKPKNTAKTLCVLYPGEEVSTEERGDAAVLEVGPWLRLSGGPLRIGDVLTSESGAWVLWDAIDIGLGKLLEPV
mmetsp:Transcript_43780/g.112727  ORF Transcript_43780/g.112727 Transcript_43780/m.112727 type:complete len:353 (-) Transcript_43780:214-1272(-)